MVETFDGEITVRGYHYPVRWEVLYLVNDLHFRDWATFDAQRPTGPGRNKGAGPAQTSGTGHKPGGETAPPKVVSDKDRANAAAADARSRAEASESSAHRNASIVHDATTSVGEKQAAVNNAFADARMAAFHSSEATRFSKEADDPTHAEAARQAASRAAGAANTAQQHLSARP